MSAGNPMERLQALDAVDNEIITCVHTAGLVLAELSKDKPSGKLADQHVATFMKSMNHVELEISKHINYLTQVSTGHSHEGSSYASQKVLQMAWHRSEHARSRAMDLDRMKAQMQQAVTSSFPSQVSQQQTRQPVTPRGGSGMSSHPPTPTASIGGPMSNTPAPPSTPVHTPQTPYSGS